MTPVAGVLLLLIAPRVVRAVALVVGAVAAPAGPDRLSRQPTAAKLLLSELLN